MTRLSAVAAWLLAAVAIFGQTSPIYAQEDPKKPTRPTELVVDVKLIDDSVVKLTLLEGQVEFMTPHGRLLIPITDIRKVDLGLRIPDDVAALIQSAAVDLGSAMFRKREEATALLLKYREKSYPTLKEAAKSSDAEVAKRAEELLEKLEATVAQARLNLPDYDVIHTDQSKIAGKITVPTLRARSFTFGDIALKLADVVALSTNGFKEKDELAQMLPDPGSMSGYQQPVHIGKTYTFRVTGAAGGSLWGTEMYTLDSTLAAAAVHMGILKVGQVGNVKVTILGPSIGFVGSTQNGLTSTAYANYPGAFRVHLRER